MWSTGFVCWSILAAIPSPEANSVTFVRQGQLVLRPEYGHIYAAFTIEPILTVHNLLLDRLETLLEYQRTPEDRSQRIHILDLQKDRILTVWHLLQDRLSNSLPPRPDNVFNATLRDILLNRPAAHLSREEARVVQQVLDQPRNKDLTGNSNADVLRRVTDTFTLPENLTSIEEQGVIDRALGGASGTNVTNAAPRALMSTTPRPRETPKKRPGRSLYLSPTRPAESNPTPLTTGDEALTADLAVRLEGDSLFIMKTSRYLLDALLSDEMQLQDLDGDEIGPILAALDSIFTQWSKEFTEALKDFGMALTALRIGQISPLLFHARDLTDSILDLQDLARDRSLHPVYRSLDQLLLTLQPRVTTEAMNSVVHIDVEVPYSRETPANLYRYVPSPWITPYYYLRVEPERVYLAFDREHKYVAELDVPTMNGCQIAQGIWLCKGPLVIHQRPEESCLYNLYHQRTRGIENTCPVQVASPKEDIVRLMQNVYQVTSPNTLTVITECSDHTEPRVSSFRGQKLLNLTQECPQIVAGQLRFLHQSAGHDREQLQRVNFTEDTSVWLENLLTDPREWVLSKLLKDLEKVFAKPVPLHALKDHINKFIWEQIKDALVYVILTGFPLLCLSVLGLCVRSCRHHLNDIFPPDTASSAGTEWPAERRPLRSPGLLALERL